MSRNRAILPFLVVAVFYLPKQSPYSPNTERLYKRRAVTPLCVVRRSPKLAQHANSLRAVCTRIVIMTFELSRLSERKLIKSGVFIKKVGITFYRFSENPKIPAGNAEQKVGITFFLKQIKSPSFVTK